MDIVVEEKNIKMKQLFKINAVLQRRCALEWRRLLEQSRRLVGLFNKGQLVVFGRLRKGHCLGVLYMSRQIVRLYKKNGPLFTSRYLKLCNQQFMWYVGSGTSSPPPSLEIPISLTRCGLPRIIPPHYRKMIRGGDAQVIKMVMTIFAFYRIMKVGNKASKKVKHSSIVFPKYEPSEAVMTWAKTLLTSSGSMLSAYAPRFREIPLNLGFEWSPVFTSGPNTYKRPSEASVCPTFSSLLKAYVDKRVKRGLSRRYNLTVFHTLPVDATALMTLIKPEKLAEFAGIFAGPRVHMPEDGYDAPVEPSREGVDVVNWLVGDLLIPVAQKRWWDTMTTRPESGRFGLKVEGAGKVRVFAIANPLLQKLLKPLHDWIMSVLRLIPMDGTYDQLAPLHRLRGSRVMYSFDLKSATDMLPSVVTGSMLSGLFGDHVGNGWFEIMTGTAFRSPEKCGSPLRARVYRFTRGQPLGFYSSWPAFTLTHHMLVWLAAWRVYPCRIFKDYALLGDDIVIADEKVAKAYQDIMSEAGGVISLEKSLISHNGCCEFAKRFIYKSHVDGGVDVSPVSTANLILAYSSLAASTFESLGCSFTASFRLRGAGYRTLAKVDRSKPEKVFLRLSRRWRRHWLSLYSSSGLVPLPLDLWLAFPEKGCLTCYEVGVIRWYLIRSVAPKPIDEESIALLRCFWYGHEEVLERFLSSFVVSHLKYVKWYCDILFDYECHLGKILDAPVSASSINRTSEDKIFSRYGIIYRAWDYLRNHPRVLAIDSHNPKIVKLYRWCQ